MVQIQEATRSDLLLRTLKAAAGDHGPAAFYTNGSAEDMVIADVILKARLDIEIFTIDAADDGALARALRGKNAWITGLRGDAGSAHAVPLYEYDAEHGLLRFNPLAEWAEHHVRDYLRQSSISCDGLPDGRIVPADRTANRPAPHSSAP
jgi:3'-phosphoadenosine 5'-phosphosulfate sulfotransferase (PAPS reductase)/FAD synthetase